MRMSTPGLLFTYMLRVCPSTISGRGFGFLSVVVMIRAMGRVGWRVSCSLFALFSGRSGLSGRTDGLGQLVLRRLRQHVLEGGPGGDHGKHVVRFDALGVDENRTIVVVEGLLQLLAH